MKRKIQVFRIPLYDFVGQAMCPWWTIRRGKLYDELGREVVLGVNYELYSNNCYRELPKQSVGLKDHEPIE